MGANKNGNWGEGAMVPAERNTFVINLTLNMNSETNQGTASR